DLRLEDIVLVLEKLDLVVRLLEHDLVSLVHSARPVRRLVSQTTELLPVVQSLNQESPSLNGASSTLDKLEHPSSSLCLGEVIPSTTKLNHDISEGPEVPF